MEFGKVVEVTPAYDCIKVQPCVHGSERCKPGAPYSHGRCAAKMFWSLRGEAGAVEFMFFTGMFLPETPPQRSAEPSGGSVAIHSAFQMENAIGEHNNCELTGGHCWHDLSCLAADDLLNILVIQGSDALWSEMQEWYECMKDRQTRFMKAAT